MGILKTESSVPINPLANCANFRGPCQSWRDRIPNVCLCPNNARNHGAFGCQNSSTIVRQRNGKGRRLLRYRPYMSSLSFRPSCVRFGCNRAQNPPDWLRVGYLQLRVQFVNFGLRSEMKLRVLFVNFAQSLSSHTARQPILADTQSSVLFVNFVQSVSIRTVCQPAFADMRLCVYFVNFTQSVGTAQPADLCSPRYNHVSIL